MPGPVLDAMKRGRTAAGYNPMDATRMAQRLAVLKKAGERKPRKPRPQRKPRTPR